MLQFTLPELFVALGQVRPTGEGVSATPDTGDKAAEFASLLQTGDEGPANQVLEGPLIGDVDPLADRRPAAVATFIWPDGPSDRGERPDSDKAAETEDATAPPSAPKLSALIPDEQGVPALIPAGETTSIAIELSQAQPAVQSIPPILPLRPLRSPHARPVTEAPPEAHLSLARELPVAPQIRRGKEIEPGPVILSSGKGAMLDPSAPVEVEPQIVAVLGPRIEIAQRGPGGGRVFPATATAVGPAQAISEGLSRPDPNAAPPGHNSTGPMAGQPERSNQSQKSGFEGTWPKSETGPGPGQGPVGRFDDGVRPAVSLNRASPEALEPRSPQAGRPGPDPEGTRERQRLPDVNLLPANSGATGMLAVGVSSSPMGMASDSLLLGWSVPALETPGAQSPGKAPIPKGQVADGPEMRLSRSERSPATNRRGEATDAVPGLAENRRGLPILADPYPNRLAPEPDLFRNAYPPMTAKVRIIPAAIAASHGDGKRAPPASAVDRELSQAADLGRRGEAGPAAKPGFLPVTGQGGPNEVAPERLWVGSSVRTRPSGKVPVASDVPIPRVDEFGGHVRGLRTVHSIVPPAMAAWVSDRQALTAPGGTWPPVDAATGMGAEMPRRALEGLADNSAPMTQPPANRPVEPRPLSTERTLLPPTGLAPHPGVSDLGQSPSMPRRAPEGLVANPVPMAPMPTYRLVEPRRPSTERRVLPLPVQTPSPQASDFGKGLLTPRRTLEGLAAKPDKPVPLMQAPAYRLIEPRPGPSEGNTPPAASEKLPIWAGNTSGHAMGPNGLISHTSRFSTDPPSSQPTLAAAPPEGRAALVATQMGGTGRGDEYGFVAGNFLAETGDILPLNRQPGGKAATALTERRILGEGVKAFEAHPLERETKVGGEITSLEVPVPEVLPGQALSVGRTGDGSMSGLLPGNAAFADQPGQAKDLPKQALVSLITGLRQAEREEKVEVLLEPSELGRIRFEIVSEGERLQVTVSVERPETLDLLRRNTDLLREEFRQAGFDSASLGFGQWGSGARPHSDGQSATHDQMPDPDPISTSSPLGRPPGLTSSGLDLRL